MSVPTPSTAHRPPASPRRATRFAGRAAVISVAAAASLVALAGTASAHITANPPTAPQGGDAKISFRTPNEEDTANTVKLEVDFPTDHPVPGVLVQPMPGWTAAVEKTKLATPIKTDDAEVTEAVSKITWSGGQIAPGQFDDFNVSLESLPTDTDQLVFKTIQTYSNGDVVRWIDATAPGGPEPEHPAPTLTLTKAAPTNASAAAPTGSSGSGGPALTLGIIGTVLGLIGAVLGALSLRRRGRGSHAS